MREVTDFLCNEERTRFCEQVYPEVRDFDGRLVLPASWLARTSEYMFKTYGLVFLEEITAIRPQNAYVLDAAVLDLLFTPDKESKQSKSVDET